MFKRKFTSTFLLLTFYFSSTLTLLNICTRQGKVLYRSRQGAALPSLRYDEMPIKGKKCSQPGNMAFPAWEHDIPTLGIYCRDTSFSLSRDRWLVEAR